MTTATTNPKPKTIQIPACPACSHTRGTTYQPKPELRAGGSGAFVYECGACEAVFSNNMYLGESYEIVLPFMTSEDVPQDRQRYFDFTCLGSKGITRRHGWFDVETKRIVQVG
jgi:hypothetical protein